MLVREDSVRLGYIIFLWIASLNCLRIRETSSSSKEAPPMGLCNIEGVLFEFCFYDVLSEDLPNRLTRPGINGGVV